MAQDMRPVSANNVSRPEEETAAAAVLETKVAPRAVVPLWKRSPMNKVHPDANLMRTMERRDCAHRWLLALETPELLRNLCWDWGRTRGAGRMLQ